MIREYTCGQALAYRSSIERRIFPVAPACMYYRVDGAEAP